jgi:AcrR family transcriptional regulator
MTNTKDLRYVRTEEAIRKAFMDLVGETPIASITASAVCRRAGISRNAFYLHHASVSDLYAAMVGELVNDVRTESLSSAERRASTGADDVFYESIVMLLARHENLLRALLPSDDGSLAKCLADGIEAAFIEAALHFGERGGSLEHQLHCAYAAWALVGFASRWIADTDRPLPEGLETFQELHESAVNASVRFLM